MKLIATALGLLIGFQSASADEIAARLHAYLLAYEPQLSELIADELMEQHDVPEREGRPGAETFAKRTLRSEVAFIALPGGAGWLGFRRVMTVGGKAVAESAGSLGEVLPAGPQSDYAKARSMLAESARFNLGAPRTTNLPNLPLELLHPRHARRFTVRIAGKERVGGRHTTKLVFVESVTPTIIQAVDGGEMRSIVTAWVETVNGRLWRADVITRDTREQAAPFDAVVSVDFREHEALGLLVPTAMREKFFSDFERRAWGNASYTNYRRFQTSARILPQ